MHGPLNAKKKKPCSELLKMKCSKLCAINAIKGNKNRAATCRIFNTLKIDLH